MISKLAGRADAPAEAIREVESQIYAVPQWPIGRIAPRGAVGNRFSYRRRRRSVGGPAALVPDVTVAEAFLLESAGRFVTVVFKFVPYRLGIDEAGSGAVAAVLGFSPRPA